MNCRRWRLLEWISSSSMSQCSPSWSSPGNLRRAPSCVPPWPLVPARGTELDLAVDLINRVVEGINGPILALHVCRGNWSQKEEVLLEGSYDPLIPYFARMKVHQLVLEYATPRAGTLQALQALPRNGADRIRRGQSTHH